MDNCCKNRYDVACYDEDDGVYEDYKDDEDYEDDKSYLLVKVKIVKKVSNVVCPPPPGPQRDKIFPEIFRTFLQVDNGNRGTSDASDAKEVKMVLFLCNNYIADRQRLPQDTPNHTKELDVCSRSLAANRL